MAVRRQSTLNPCSSQRTTHFLQILSQYAECVSRLPGLLKRVVASSEPDASEQAEYDRLRNHLPTLLGLLPQAFPRRSTQAKQRKGESSDLRSDACLAEMSSVLCGFIKAINSSSARSSTEDRQKSVLASDALDPSIPLLESERMAYAKDKAFETLLGSIISA